MIKLPASRHSLFFKALSFFLSISTIFLGTDLSTFIQDAHAITCQEAFLLGMNDPSCADNPAAGGQTPTQNASSASQAQVEVDQQNTLSDIQALNFSLKTQDGDILNYAGNLLKEVVRPDGTLLSNISLNADGTIQSADLKFNDGSVQVFNNGSVVSYTAPDGTRITYEAGRIKKTLSPSGVETLYTYVKNASGVVIWTILESVNSKTTYDLNNRIKESLDKTTGTKSYYTNGVLTKIVKSDTSQYLFTAAAQGADTKISLTLYIDSQGTRFNLNQGMTTLITFKDMN